MKPGDEGEGQARVKGFLYPFGYGLSYTTFQYSDMKVTSSDPKSESNISVTFTVTNTGKIVGEYVPQLYINDELSSVTTYVKKLREFTRISLNPGESKNIAFEITPPRSLIIRPRYEIYRRTWLVYSNDWQFVGRYSVKRKI